MSNNSTQLRWQNKKRTEGLCTRCGKEPLARTSRHMCENCLKKHNDRQKARHNSLKLLAFQHYGGFICSCCGETNPLFLCIDHTNNDGNKHRKQFNITDLYKWLSTNNYPEGFQVLCMNCNFGKWRNNGVCPHKEIINENS